MSSISSVQSFVNGTSITAIGEEKDVVSFVSQLTKDLLDPSIYKGLRSIREDQLEDLLAAQNYVEVVAYVRSENNLDERIAWLKKGAEQGHVILMLELSIALAEKYGQEGPVEQIQELIRWYLLGMLCVRLDAACNQDKSAGAAIEVLRLTYGTALHDGIKAEYRNELKKSNLVEVYSSWKPQDHHPSPKWLMYHGLSHLLGNDVMQPESEWTRIRKKELESYLAAVNEAMRKKSSSLSD